MSEWISVKEKLPDHLQIVLAINLNDTMAVVRCDHHVNGSKLIDYVFMWPDLRFQFMNITHWMPLPEPPK